MTTKGAKLGPDTNLTAYVCIYVCMYVCMLVCQCFLSEKHYKASPQQGGADPLGASANFFKNDHPKPMLLCDPINLAVISGHAQIGREGIGPLQAAAQPTMSQPSLNLLSTQHIRTVGALQI